MNAIVSIWQGSDTNLQSFQNFEDEKEMLSLICKAGDSKITEEQIPRNLEHALTSLENFGLVQNNQDRLYLTANLFDSWLKRRLGV